MACQSNYHVTRLIRYLIMKATKVEQKVWSATTKSNLIYIKYSNLKECIMHINFHIFTYTHWTAVVADKVFEWFTRFQNALQDLALFLCSSNVRIIIFYPISSSKDNLESHVMSWTTAQAQQRRDMQKGEADFVDWIHCYLWVFEWHYIKWASNVK